MDVTVDPGFIREWERSDECRELVMEIGAEVEDEFRQIAPRRTGNLAASAITIPELRDGHWEAVVDTRTHYAVFVEFGTRRMEAQYNLRTALENVTGQS